MLGAGCRRRPPGQRACEVVCARVRKNMYTVIMIRRRGSTGRDGHTIFFLLSACEWPELGQDNRYLPPSSGEAAELWDGTLNYYFLGFGRIQASQCRQTVLREDQGTGQACSIKSARPAHSNPGTQQLLSIM